MRSPRLVSLVIFAVTAAAILVLFATSLQAQSNSQSDQANQSRIRDSYGNLPLSFEANQGQADSQVKFLTHTRAYSLFLTGDEAVLTLHGARAHGPKAKDKFPVETRLAASPADTKPTPNQATESILRMKLRHANANARVTGVGELEGKSNYFLGNDPAKWRTNVPTYSKVKYEAVYPGIDLVYYGNQRQLEYDFIVAPHANPRSVAFDISGASRIRKDAKGDLLFKTQEGEIRWHKPVVYQEKDGTRNEIAASYSITDKNRVGFELAKYDATKPLYIDPLIYSTYLGGSGDDAAWGIAVDSAGNTYVAGQTTSTDFPTMNPLQTTNGGGTDAFISKINPAGSALVYSTYLGGSGNDFAYGIAVDSAGNAYVTGATASTDFPTKNALQPVYGGGSYDAFLTEINPEGTTLVYSTYLGGAGFDEGQGVALGNSGNAYVTGQTMSVDFPTTAGAFQTTCNISCNDSFVAKVSPLGSSLAYATYLPGSGTVWSTGIAVDSADSAYVTGYTSAADYPTTPGAFQTTYDGEDDAFVTKLNPTGSALIYSTYLGGHGVDVGNAISVDASGNAYVAGITRSINFPTTPGAYGTVNGGGLDAFVTKLNPAGSALIYSTYYGGDNYGGSYIYGLGIAADSTGSAYVTGYIVTPMHGIYSSRAFQIKFNATGSALLSSILLQGNGSSRASGIAIDNAGNAYIAGWTAATNFPTKNPIQAASAGGEDAFVAKINTRVKTMIALSSSPNPSTYGQPVTFTATVSSTVGAPPDGATVNFMKGKTILGTGTLSSGSASFTTSTLPVATNWITAVYAGDSNLGPSTSTAVKQVVNKATTTTALASSANPSTAGQSVTFSATITPQFTAKATGNVTFYNGTTALKTVAVSSNAAKFTTSTLASGSHNITATYNGSTSFTSSSASLTQQVN
jgi:hypothetical protein